MICIDGYVVAIAKDDENYDAVMGLMKNKPTPPDGYDYRLKADLTWELYELPVIEEDPDPDLTAEEALEIIVGGAANV